MRAVCAVQNTVADIITRLLDKTLNDRIKIVGVYSINCASIIQNVCVKTTNVSGS